jgi:succinylarginine dihydrolase
MLVPQGKFRNSTVVSAYRTAAKSGSRKMKTIIFLILYPLFIIPFMERKL